MKALDQFKKPIDATINVKAVLSASAKAVPNIGGMFASGTAAAPATSVGATAVVPAHVTNITNNTSVTLPAGTTPATTLSAIRRYQRLGGDMGGLLDTLPAIR